MTDNIVQFKKHSTTTSGGDDGYGELFGTIYLYTGGHYVQFAEPGTEADDIEARRLLRSMMFTSFCYEAESIFELSGELTDMPAFFGTIYGSGRITSWAGDHLETLPQVEWVARMLRGMGVDLLRSHAYKAYPDNDNPQEPTA